MKTVTISKDEATVFETFKEGHPVQVRVSVMPGEEHDYDKGKTVKVVFENGGRELQGKIVSDPLEVRAKPDGGEKTLSIVLEKP